MATSSFFRTIDDSNVDFFIKIMRGENMTKEQYIYELVEMRKDGKSQVREEMCQSMGEGCESCPFYAKNNIDCDDAIVDVLADIIIDLRK